MDAVRLGDYLLGPALAEGAMATVNVALRVGHGGFRRVVALKRLREAGELDVNRTAMLLDEARLTARIDHPNVVRTQDVFKEGAQFVIAMDYVRGLSLLEVFESIEPRPGEMVPLSVAIGIAEDILLGLHAAHELKDPTGAALGIIHRDVSPSNIIVSSEGVSKLIDFGIAKAIGRLQLTKTGVLKGKIRYMAPETFRGSCDRRADVYSLAVSLWELVTGEPLFRGSSERELMEEIVSKPMPRPGRIRRDVPPELDRVILRGLERDPDLRFPTAKAMAEALVRAAPRASKEEIAEWLQSIGEKALAAKDGIVKGLELRGLDVPQTAATEPAEPLAIRVAPSDIAAPRTASRNDVARAPAQFRRRMRWGSAVVLVFVAAAAIYFGRSRRRASERVTHDAVAQGVGVASSSPVPSSAAVETLVPPRPPLEELADASLPKSPPPRPHGAATTRSSPVMPNAAPCSPPYWMDTKGVKHYKIECTR